MKLRYKTAEIVAGSVLVLVTALGAPGCVKIISAPLLLPETELRPADVIVVLGVGPPVDEQGRPAEELVRRVAKGVELYNAGLAPAMIMTGGNTYRDYYESSVMKEAAVDRGVPAGAIIEEREAMDTIGNARCSAGIMRDHGWERVIVVSSPYHLKRAKKLFEAAGVEVETAGADMPDDPSYGVMFSVYEYLVRINYLFIDEQGLVRGEKGDKHTDRIKGPVRARTESVPSP